MERVVARDNLKKALAQVRRNKGAPGVDGMTVDDLAAYLKDHWPEIRAQLLNGTYQPQPVRRVDIPKASGGTRGLGIPTVLDRFLQQAVMQVLQEDWDPPFSPSSYGPDAQRIRPWPPPSSSSRTDATLSWLSTWRNSSIECLTTS